MVKQIKVKAIFFDAAHTTLKLARPYSEMIAAGLSRYGFVVERTQVALALSVCWPKVEHLFNGEHTDYSVSDDWDRTMWHMFYALMMDYLGVENYPPQMLEDIYGEFRKPRNWSLYPDTVDTVRILKERGYLVGIGSNWDSSLPHILDDLGVRGHLDAEVVSCVVGHRKPGADFFKAECTALNLPPESVLHVGDHPIADVKGAISAGLCSVLVHRESSPVDSFGAPIVTDLSHLLDLL